MNLPSYFRATVLLCVLSLAIPALAQSPKIPIRAVTAPTATTATSLRSLDEVREVAAGKVLVNSGVERTVLLFDEKLSHPIAVADTMGAPAAPYPRGGRLFPFVGDSSLLIEFDSRSLILIDGAGKIGRVMALPRPQDFSSFTSGGPLGADSRGHLVYQGRRPLAFPPSCRLPGEPAAPGPPSAPVTDSVVIIRADFETRTADTIGRAKMVIAGLSFPITSTDANCRVLSAKVRVNPSIPSADSWTVTSRGVVAIVRGHDYHIDWINADGTTRSTPKMPYDWRRLTDADKQAKIDSARKIIDSLSAIGGYRLQACGGGRSLNFNTDPPRATDGVSGPIIVGGGVGGVGGGRAGGGGDVPPIGAGRGNNDCQTVTVAAEFVPLDSMADYIAPIREKSARADLDGNVWILPATSAGAKGGLLYDVVNPNGELFERVQLPADRDIAGFGRGGVLYLSRGDRVAGFVIEKVKVVRGA